MSTGAAAVAMVTRSAHWPWKPKVEIANNWDLPGLALLAAQACPACMGYGVVNDAPCKCVLRLVFRRCLNNWTKGHRFAALTGVRLGLQSNPTRSNFYSRPLQEFAADFELVARRALSPAEHRLFRLYYLERRNWRLCVRKLGMPETGNFFKIAQRIEITVAKAALLTKPYPLYPSYFRNGFRSHAQ